MDKDNFQKSCTLPPWLWCWLILNIYNFFDNQIFHWKAFWDSFSSFTVIFESVPELVPPLALFFGVVIILFPKFRSIWFKHKYQLEDFETGFPKIPDMYKNSALEIKDFLRSYEPKLQINVNFLRFNTDQCIYASGYHKASIALFSNILLLWRKDPEVAKAVLLHEIGHYRNGDASIIGAGNFLELTIGSSLAITLFFLIPFILSVTSQEITFIKSMIGQENIFISIFFHKNSLSSSLINYELKQFFSNYIPFILFTTLMLLLNVINTLFMPIVGIWCAELNADRFMADASDSINISEKAVDSISKTVSISGRVKYLIFHPPKWLRKLMLKDTKQTKKYILLLLIYPFADLFQLLIYKLQYLMIYVGANSFDSYEYLKTLASFRFPIYAVLILIWPFISVYWTRFFSGAIAHFDWKVYSQYVASAGILLFLSILMNHIFKL